MVSQPTSVMAAAIGPSPLRYTELEQTVTPGSADDGYLGYLVTGIPAGTVNDGSITAAKLATGAVTSTKLGTKAVVTAALDDLAVTTAKLADTGVTTGKLADLAVTGAKIAATTVATGNLADLGVTTAKLAASAVTAAKVAAGAIAATAIANNAAATWPKLSPLLMLIMAVTAGVTGTADDFTILTNAPTALLIVDGFFQVTGGANSGNSTYRDATGGGGNALSNALSCSSNGYKRLALTTAMQTVALGGNIYLRRDNDNFAGMAVLFCLPVV